MDTKFDITRTYEESVGLSDLYAAEGPDVDDSVAKSITGILSNTLMNLAPNLSTKSDEISSSNLHPLTKGGALGFVDSNLTAILYNPPSVDVAGHLAQEWVPGFDTTSNSAYAQDGYELLRSIGVDDLWQKTRTLAYVIFVVVLIVSGFMIMFRQKIGGQAAITVFNTLPNVIVGLILVTFSFAIVGLAINLGVLMVNVVASLLSDADFGQFGFLTVNNPISLSGVFFRGDAGIVSPETLLVGLVGVIIGALALIAAGAGTGGAAIVAGVIVGLIGLAIGVIVVIIVISVSVRVYITVLKAYLGLIMDTVMAPIYITISTFPGKSSILGDWFKRVAKNILVFPMVFFLINIGLYILRQDLNLNFPTGLVGGGDPSVGVDATIAGVLMKGLLVLLLFYVAADSPKFLDDILPVSGGKGAAAVGQSIQKRASKIPGIGSLFSE